jgi:hypothetical protein
MSMLIRSTLVALVLTSASAVIAAPADNRTWTDRSQAYGGYDADSQEGARAFWDYQTRRGGN